MIPDKRQIATIKVEAKGKGNETNKSMKRCEPTQHQQQNPFFDFAATNDPPSTLRPPSDNIVALWCLFVYSAYCC